MNNFFLLKPFLSQLGQKLNGLRLLEQFTPKKGEVHFVFEGEQHFHFFADGRHSFIHSMSVRPPRHLPPPPFPELLNQQVAAIELPLGERHFSIHFSGGQILLFKLYGRNANVLAYENADALPTLFFPQLKSDHGFKFSDLGENALKTPLLPPQLEKAVLAENPEFNTLSSKEQIVVGLAKAEQLMQAEGLCVLETNKLQSPIALDFGHPPNQQPLFSGSNPIEAVNEFVKIFLGRYFFNLKKEALLQSKRQEIKSLGKKIKQNKVALAKLENRRSYRELGDLIMANLHQLPEQFHTKEIEIWDFYQNQNLRLPVKMKQRPSEMAEKYYQKAKKEHLEKALLMEKIEKGAAQKQAAEKELEDIGSIQENKKLKSLDKAKQQEQQQTKKKPPFKRFEVEGYSVFVGKGPKNNDELSFKFARKDDLWLHARGVGGAHVIIRKENSLPIPQKVIEKVAGIAAFYSKGKSSDLCPVIFTPKKFIYKAKKALPGQVQVKQEEVIMAVPSLPEENSENL